MAKKKIASKQVPSKKKRVTSKSKKTKSSSRMAGVLKAGAKQVANKKAQTQKKVDDILLKLGPSLSTTLQIIQDHIESGVSKVEDVKRVGLQILSNAQKISSSLKKKKEKKGQD